MRVLEIIFICLFLSIMTPYAFSKDEERRIEYDQRMFLNERIESGSFISAYICCNDTTRYRSIQKKYNDITLQLVFRIQIGSSITIFDKGSKKWVDYVCRVKGCRPEPVRMYDTLNGKTLNDLNLRFYCSGRAQTNLDDPNNAFIGIKVGGNYDVTVDGVDSSPLSCNPNTEAR